MRSGRWWLTLLIAVVAMAVTASLGRWQLSRADQKLALQKTIQAQMDAPVLTERDLELTPASWGELHRRVSLQGYWMHQHTVFLDNRVYNGRAGFWVLTPLLLDDQTAVLVQRGWIPRHQQDRTLLAPIGTEEGLVRVNGRIAQGPSEVMGLGENETTAQTSGQSPIRQNLNVAAFGNELGISIAATVLQTDADAEGLQRSWPEITAGVEKHWGYAFQWFALAVLQLMLYFWYQWIKPYRHAR